LGNKRIVKYTKSNTMPFEECKKFVRNLGVTTGSEWFRWCKKNKKPDNIPYNPDEVYKEWTTWGDFLGPLPEKWKSFEDARKFAHSLKLKNPGEWNKFSKLGKRPEDIPAGPRGVYKEDWIGWSDFLGTGNLNSQQLQEQYISYDDAKKYVQKQGIKTVPKFNEWSSQGKRPLFIPAKPQKFYKEWIDWDDFFGRDKKIIISFEDARKFARSLNLTYRSEWFELYDKGKLPKDLPKYVNERYPDQGWNGWSDFLGSTAALSGLQRNKQMRSYEECKKFVRNLGIKTETQWREWNDNDNNQRPVDIPYSFQKSYPNEWKKNGGMGGFLGTGRIADKNKVWMSFEKARTIVQKLGLKNMDEYKKELNAGKIPKNIPANPNKVYQNKGWESNGDWLGTGTISNRKKSQAFLSAKEAKPVLKKLFKEYDIKNLSDWREFSKTHIKLLEELHIPSKLLRTYSLKNANRKSKK